MQYHLVHTLSGLSTAETSVGGVCTSGEREREQSCGGRYMCWGRCNVEKQYNIYMWCPVWPAHLAEEAAASSGHSALSAAHPSAAPASLRMWRTVGLVRWEGGRECGRR